MIHTVYPIPFVGADDSVRPQKSGVFPWSFVGADAHLGAKSRALRGCASKLACGRRIGPLKCFGFASDFRKNGQFRRADRVVRPYGVGWEINTDSPEKRHKTGVFGGSMWASTPTARNGRRGGFSHDPHGLSNTLCRGGRLCPPSKIRRFSVVVRRGRCPSRR